MAAAPRPPWYSFARRSTTLNKPTQQYASDARSALSKGITEAAVLPVSLQMPTDQVVDPAVNRTRGESFTVGQRPSPPSPVRVMEEEINPLPPAAEPAPPVVVNRMPNLPAVDPIQGPPVGPVMASPSDRPDPSMDSEGSKAAMIEEVNPLPPAADSAPGTTPTVVVDRKPAPAPKPTATTQAVIETRKVDDQAVKAIPDEEETGDKTVLAEFLHKCILKVKKKHSHPITVVMPTPQSDPKPKPTVQVMPKPKVVVVQPTPQVKPASPVVATSDDCSKTGCHHSSKKFCMRRLVRRMMHLGEFSDSSTVATH